jgi:hypothetical protein
MKLQFSILALLTGAALIIPSADARAGHVYAGVLDTNGTPGIQDGEALAFLNRTTGLAMTPLGTQSLLNNDAAYPGLWVAGNAINSITYTALARGTTVYEPGGTATSAAVASYGTVPVSGSPVNGIAAGAGSFVQLRIGSVSGPNGAVFTFWQDAVAVVSYKIGTGFLTTAHEFDVTDKTARIGSYDGALNGDPATDPFGHIHGRQYTFDQPGAYTVNFVLTDKAGKQADSAPFVVGYQSVPEPGATLMILGGMSVLAAWSRHRRRC